MKPLFVFVGLSFLSLILGCSSNIPSAPSKLSNGQLVTHTSASTVALVLYEDDNVDETVSDIRAYCTGVWVDGSHILTAHHCIKAVQEKLQEKQDEKEKNPAECGLLQQMFGECPGAPVHKEIGLMNLPIHFVQWKEEREPGQEPTAWHLGQVVGWDEHHDLALVEALGHALPVHEVAQLAKATPDVGEAVHIVGHVRGLYWTYLEGTVAAYRQSLPHMDKRGGPFMQVQAPVYYGNSGGGAFNDFGELVGIADFLMRTPGEAGFVHLESVRLFLQKQHVLEAPPVEVSVKEKIGIGDVNPAEEKK